MNSYNLNYKHFKQCKYSIKLVQQLNLTKTVPQKKSKNPYFAGLLIFVEFCCLDKFLEINTTGFHL